MKFLAYLIVQRGRTATPYRPAQRARPRAHRRPQPAPVTAPAGEPAGVPAGVPAQRSPVVRQDPAGDRVRVVVDDVHEPA